MQDCNFLDVPVSQSDHNQLRGLPNLQRLWFSTEVAS